KSMAEFPTLVSGAAHDLMPHRIIFYLMDLAGQFHSFYNKHKVLSDDRELSGVRLALCGALKQVLANGLHLLGVSAPEKM
ncbi:MAG: DALR anticodon-binding domain-containing protein, partial [Desulfobulbaceae bacterium]|nr:DALR anticodon-binding domain-containing protein [Desulfobulbaceae bacterium]